MFDLIEQYPIIAWTLVGFGVLALLSKYLKFDPIDNLIDRVKNRYKYEEINHLNDAHLKQLIEDVNNNQFDKVKASFESIEPSYISFGFRSLGQYANPDAIEAWITKEPTNSLPQIVKAYQCVFKGWEARGRQTIDEVSEKNLRIYKDYLNQAKELLLRIGKDSSYQANVNALLLKIYKAIDVDRNTIHQTFLEVEKGNEDHAELNFNYFSAISPKWGGSEVEVKAYLNTLEKRSEFIGNLILVQYYFDYVRMEGGEDTDHVIQAFIEKMKSFSISDKELYKYEFYLLLYWLSNNLMYVNSENHFKELVHPFWRD